MTRHIATGSSKDCTKKNKDPDFMHEISLQNNLQNAGVLFFNRTESFQALQHGKRGEIELLQNLI